MINPPGEPGAVPAPAGSGEHGTPRSSAALWPGIVCLVLVCAATAVARPESSGLSPDHAGTNRAWSLAFLAALGAAFCAYIVGLWTLSRRRVPLAPVLAVTAAIQLVPLAAPVLLSTDVYTYWARARVSAVHSENPYTTAPSVFPADPAFERMGRSWRDRPTGYGPAFTLLSEGHAVAVGEAPPVAALAYRGLAAGAVLVIAGLAAALARNGPFAAAFVGWSPLLAIHFGGGGHNDAVMMALVMAALFATERGRMAASGALWAGAILVKWVPVVLMPLSLLETRRRGRASGRFWVGFALAGLAVAGVASWRYGPDWLRSFGNFSGQLERTTSVSAGRLLTALGVSEDASIALLLTAFAAAYIWLLREAWRGRARLGLCAGLLVLTSSWLVPWYAIWVLPLAAVEEDRAARLLAIGLSAYLLRAAVPV